MNKRETAARLLYYKLYNYNVYIEDIINGKEYEYRAASFKTKLPHGGYCINTEVWQKGKWKSPFGLISKENLMNSKKERGLRYKNAVSTVELKKILEENPLQFKYKDLDIVVFPRKHALTPLVYINGVNEWKLRGMYNTDLYKAWFNSELLVDALQKDWRYLLGLDYYTPSANHYTDELWKYVVGVWTGDPLKLDKSTMAYELKHNHLIMSETKETVTRLPRKSKKLEKKLNKLERQSKKYEGPRWSHKKSDEEVSAHVLTKRQEKSRKLAVEIQTETAKYKKNPWPKIKYINGERHVLEVTYEMQIITVPKKREVWWETDGDGKRTKVEGPTTQEVEQVRVVKRTYIPKPITVVKTKPHKDPNFSHRKQIENERDSLVCIRNVLTEEIDRIPKLEAKIKVDQQEWVYSSKSAYKKYKKDMEKGPKVGLTPSHLTGTGGRYQPKPPKKGAGSMFAKLQSIPVKDKDQAVDKQGYLLENVKRDDKGKVISGDRIEVKETKARATSIPEYEMVPVYKNKWNITIDETGKRIKDLIGKVPFMIPRRQEDGTLKEEQVFKRRLKKVWDKLPVEVTKELKATYKVITTYQFPAHIATLMHNAKKDMQTASEKTKSNTSEEASTPS